jgi:hypothetical protein
MVDIGYDPEKLESLRIILIRRGVWNLFNRDEYREASIQLDIEEP